MLDALAVVVRTLLYAGILSGVGAVLAKLTLALSTNGAHFATQAMRRGAWLTVVASPVGLVVLIFRLGGQFDAATISAIFSSGTGAAAFMQAIGALLLLTSIDSSKTTLLTGALITTVSFAFNGHAASAGLFEGILVALHVTAAAWWVGSLWLLRYVCLHATDIEIASLVRRFSAIAVLVVGGLIVAGLLLVLMLVPFAELPALSSYERNLAIKLGLVVAVLALAGYNKFRLTPRLLASDTNAASVLRRVVEVELAVIGLVLAATAVLITFTSPDE